MAQAGDLPVLRVAVLQIGTVNWELQTIVRNELDREHGFRLEVQPFADNGATRVALAGGTADVAVADWIWAARQRAAGQDYVFIPYSKAVGGLVVAGDSPVQSLADLRGQKIGIAGGPLDKSWLILRAYAAQVHAMDLDSETEPVFGAPPLMFKLGLSGETAGTVNFWHFLAKMKAAGQREVVSVAEATSSLGLNPDTPLLGYVMKESLLDMNPDLAQGFYNASQDAKELLRDDAAWQAIRPLMGAATEAEFSQLRKGFREGMPDRAPIDQADAARFLALMAELGGDALVGQATTLPAGLFADVE
ncbi:ABC transporter substrate-binding protein [Roseovarius sp. CAU 1744]|uniref:ABC transporter substrate-binding protein n=1 Tax=Roseovarius sp. CAU 1744 TaxID=3140368 RepID=UPI00325AB953